MPWYVNSLLISNYYVDDFFYILRFGYIFIFHPQIFV